jgi:hypothetical protein
MGPVKQTTGGSAHKAMNRPVTTTEDMTVIESNSAKITDDKVIKRETTSSVHSKEQFRFRWQKKLAKQPVAVAGSRDNERAYLKTPTSRGQVANTSKVANVKKPKHGNHKALEKPKRGDIVDDDPNDSDYVGDGGAMLAIEDDHGGSGSGVMLRDDDGQDDDEDWEQEDDSDDDGEQKPKAFNQSVPRKKTGRMLHPNGRLFGRKLVMWHRKFIPSFSSAGYTLCLGFSS